MTLEQAKEAIRIDLESTFRWVRDLSRLQGSKMQDAGYNTDTDILNEIRKAVEAHCKMSDKLLDSVPE